MSGVDGADHFQDLPYTGECTSSLRNDTSRFNPTRRAAETPCAKVRSDPTFPTQSKAGGANASRLAQAAGVSFAVWANWAVNQPRKDRSKIVANWMLSRRQVSTIDTIAATRGPASLLPMWIQFLRLCKALHRTRWS